MLVDLFAEDDSPAAEIIHATPGKLSGWATYDLPSVPTWHRGSMIVIGDAAHATAPSSGQGASMAIEDAVVLARCLRDLPEIPHAHSPPTSGYAASGWSASSRTGRGRATAKPQVRSARVIRDLMMPMILKRVANGGSLAWMHDYRIVWDEKVA